MSTPKRFKQDSLIKRSVKLHTTAKKAKDSYEKSAIVRLVRQVIQKGAEKKFNEQLDTFTAGGATVGFLGVSLMGTIIRGTSPSQQRVGDKVRVCRVSWAANIAFANQAQSVRLILFRDTTHAGTTTTVGNVITVPNTQLSSIISGYNQEFNSNTVGSNGMHILVDKTFPGSVVAQAGASSNYSVSRRSMPVEWQTSYSANNTTTADVDVNELQWLCIFSAFSGTSAATVLINTQILYTDV